MASQRFEGSSVSPSIRVQCLESSGDADAESVLMVKLTDEMFSALVAASKKNSGKLQLCVNSKGGTFNLGSYGVFHFQSQLLNDETDTVSEDNTNQKYRMTGSFKIKYQIQATDRSFVDTREKAQKLVEEQKIRGKIEETSRKSRPTVHRPPSINRTAPYTKSARSTLRRHVKKTKVKREFLRPNAIDVHFGCMSPLAVMVRPVHMLQKKYVKPDGAARITIIGFIEEEEAVIRGFGFHRRFDLLDAYQEPCFKQNHSSYDPRSIKRNKIQFEAMSRGLRTTGTSAYCILHEKDKTNKASYGFVMIERQREVNHLILGVLKDDIIGCETWNERLEWIVKAKDYKMPPFVRIPLQICNKQCWIDQPTMAKFTTGKFPKLSSGSVSEFSNLVDGMLDHSHTLGMEMYWLKEMLNYYRSEIKSKEAAQAIEAATKKIEAKSRASE